MLKPLKPVAATGWVTINPDADGLDNGASEIWVAAPDRDPQPVRCLATFPPDLQRLAD